MLLTSVEHAGGMARSSIKHDKVIAASVRLAENEDACGTRSSIASFWHRFRSVEDAAARRM
jgi:hypothetical protein